MASVCSSALSSASRLMISSLRGRCCRCRGSSVNTITGRGVVVVVVGEGENVGKNGVGVVSIDIKLSEMVGRNTEEELSSKLASSSLSEL